MRVLIGGSIEAEAASTLDQPTLRHVADTEVEGVFRFAGNRIELLDGLPRTFEDPAKFLYDARGSELFDAICELPEYYLTRTETGILQSCTPELARLAGPGCALVEFGSGSSVKTRLLLDAMPDAEPLQRAGRTFVGGAGCRGLVDGRLARR